MKRRKQRKSKLDADVQKKRTRTLILDSRSMMFQMNERIVAECPPGMRHITCHFPLSCRFAASTFDSNNLCQYQPTLMLTFDDVEETYPPAARAVKALSAVLPPKLVAVRSMILPDVEASMVGVQLCVFSLL